MRQTFIFYIDWYNYIEEDIEQEGLRLRLYQAIPKYAFTGEEPQDPAMRVLFSFIRRQLDRDNKKYEEKIEKRREAGRKGNEKRWGKKEESSQMVANIANATNSSQMVANIAVNNNGNVNTNDKDLKAPNGAMSPGGDAALPPKKTKVEIDYDKLKNFWNTTMQIRAIPQIKEMTPARMAMVRARCEEYGKQAVFDVIKKSAESSFLNGGGSKGQVYNFDWIFRPNNFPKVLEGNYENRIINTNNGINRTGTTKEQMYDDAAELVSELLTGNG